MNKQSRITPPLSGVEYFAPDVEILDVVVEAGFATSFSYDPTVDGENEIDPYAY